MYPVIHASHLKLHRNPLSSRPQRNYHLNPVRIIPNDNQNNLVQEIKLNDMIPLSVGIFLRYRYLSFSKTLSNFLLCGSIMQ